MRRGSMERARNSPSIHGVSAHFRALCVEKSPRKVSTTSAGGGTTAGDRNAENDEAQLRQTGVPAHEWRLYGKLRGRGVQRADLCAVSCPFSVFLPAVKSPIQRKAARRVTGSNTSRTHRKVGSFRTRPPPTERASARAARWCISRSYACSVRGERSGRSFAHRA